MSFSVEWERDSFDELNKLQGDITKRILEKIDLVKENPIHFIEKLKDMPEFKIRVGDFRVILLLDNTNKIIKIQAVGHRKNIYKRYKTD